MPGIIPWSGFVDVMSNLWIPGNRNFLVTYDGTLWAMNANIMGNVIGSNILGGRIQGGEIGIGVPKNGGNAPYTFYEITDRDCGWSSLKPPIETKITRTYS